MDVPKSAQQLGGGGKKEVSAKRKRLHILYLIHDLVHHTKVRGGDSRVAHALEMVLEGLFGLMAQGKGVKHEKKVDRLLQLWSDRDYYPSSTISRLRDAVRTAQQSSGDTTPTRGQKGEKGEDGKAKEKREQPYDMPATHGDYNTAWYDLPAANLMQHIVPNSTKPIKGSMVQPLQFVPGPAEKGLADAVKHLIDDAHNLFGEGGRDGEAENWDIDELGQRVVKDELRGRKIEETYYGWSEEFAIRMGRKKKGLGPSTIRDNGRDSRNDRDRSYSSSRSMSRSRSRSRSPAGRGMGFGRGRKGSYSGSDSRSRSRSRGYGGRGHDRGGLGAGGGIGRSATPENMMPRGLGY